MTKAVEPITFAKLAETLREFLANADETDVCNAMSLIGDILAKTQDYGDRRLGEAYSHLRFPSSKAFGQLLMAMLASQTSVDTENFSTEDKMFWLGVGDHIGPDWIARMRMLGAFMDKVGSWHR